MKLGVIIKDTWAFFSEIYEDLSQHHQVSLFKHQEIDWPVLKSRINQQRFNQALGSFLRNNDLVFFEWASELLAVASHFPKTCKIVTRLHRYELYQWADQVNWDAVDRVILVTKSKQDEFLARFPHLAGRTSVVPEAVSLQRFQPTERAFNSDIGILGHLTPRKRVYELILTFYELLQVHDSFHLHIGGGPKPRFLDYYASLHSLVRRLGLEDKVTFYGNVVNPEEWYRKIDIFISNSYSEGLQVSPIEAMASGCYCLSHHWDGADELLPPEHLYFTDSQMIRLILQYADQPAEKKNALRGQMRLIVQQKFNIEKTKDEIRQILEDTASLPPKPRISPI